MVSRCLRRKIVFFGAMDEVGGSRGPRGVERRGSWCPREAGGSVLGKTSGPGRLLLKGRLSCPGRVAKPRLPPPGQDLGLGVGAAAGKWLANPPGAELAASGALAFWMPRGSSVPQRGCRNGEVQQMARETPGESLAPSW